MGRAIDILEQHRLTLQTSLDGQKTQAERNRLGQFSTPAALARDILGHAAQLLPEDQPVRFLDPALGTGAFYSALRTVFPAQRVAEACGFEIDPHFGLPAAQLWGGSGLSVSVTDFTHQAPEPRFNLVICNPPYVRHHHLAAAEKARLRAEASRRSGTKLGGLAGLYCHFLCLSHAWMADCGIAGWLVPSEFMDVNYGAAVKRYLLEKVTLLHIHRFEPNDVQFADALVSSAVVWFRKAPPPPGHAARFTFGGSLSAPHLAREVPAAVLAEEAKWTRFPTASPRLRTTGPTVADFFRIKRGLATGDNGFFILGAEEITARGLPHEAFRPILPSPRHVPGDIVEADGEGNPLLDRPLFLLDPPWAEEEIARRFPALAAYLDEGRKDGLPQRYLCRHRSRWYAQENRPPAPIVCTYLGRSGAQRSRPFRFILNRSRATVANVYLAMYPTPLLDHHLSRDPGLIERVWRALNGITPDHLTGEGRVYGGGLHKLEPKELANVPMPILIDFLPHA